LERLFTPGKGVINVQHLRYGSRLRFKQG
jgi:hypothetical protein